MYGVERVELVQTLEGQSRCWSTPATDENGRIEVVSPACPTSVLKTIFCVKGIDPHIKINVLARARHACAHRRVPPMSPPGGRQSKGVMLERFAGSPGSKARSALPTSHRQTRVVCTSRTRSDRAGCVAASGKREGSSGVPCCDTPYRGSACAQLSGTGPAVRRSA